MTKKYIKKRYYIINRKSLNILRRMLKGMPYNNVTAGLYPHVLHLNRQHKPHVFETLLTVIIIPKSALQRATEELCQQHTKELPNEQSITNRTEVSPATP